MHAKDIIKQMGKHVKLEELLIHYQNIVKQNFNPENQYENLLRNYSLRELKRLEEFLDEEENNKGTTSL